MKELFFFLNVQYEAFLFQALKVGSYCKLDLRWSRGALGNFKINPKALTPGQPDNDEPKKQTGWKAFPLRAALGPTRSKYRSIKHGWPRQSQMSAQPSVSNRGHGRALQTQSSGHHSQPALTSGGVVHTKKECLGSQNLRGADGFQFRALSISNSAGNSLSLGFP